jgi:hypothetical protein
MIHHQTDNEVILISRYSTIGDLRKRIKQFKGSSDFLLCKANKFEESYREYQLMFKKKEESLEKNILIDDEIPIWKLGSTEEYTLIINHLDMYPIEKPFDQVDESMDEGKIGNLNLLYV